MSALEDTAAHFEQARLRFEAHKENAGKFYTRPDNSDSWTDVCQRTYMFLGKLFQPNRDGAHVLILSRASEPCGVHERHVRRPDIPHQPFVESTS